MIPRCLGTSQSVREQHRVVGEVRARGPHLLAVDDEFVAVAHRGRGHAGEVGPGARFAEELAPDVVAREHLRQEELLLLVGAVGHDRGADHLRADREHRGRHVELHFFLGEDPRFASGATAAAVLGCPGDPRPPVLEQGALPRAAPADVFVFCFLARVGGTERDRPVAEPLAQLGVSLEERAHLGAERFLGCGFLLYVGHDSPLNSNS